jgi:hypothetical protein
VNLGKPPWTNPETRIPTPSGTTRPASRSTDKSQTAAVERLNDKSLQAAKQGQNYSPSGGW